MTSGASDTSEPRDPLAYVRWLDVALLVFIAPVLLLLGLPALGVILGTVAWVLNRLLGAFLESKAKSAKDMRGQTGLLLGSMMGRAWLAGLTIIAAGLAGEREDGLTAALLVLAAFTVYFVMSLILRPERKTNKS
jgi:hypothetical protein